MQIFVKNKTKIYTSQIFLQFFLQKVVFTHNKLYFCSIGINK